MKKVRWIVLTVIVFLMAGLTGGWFLDPDLRMQGMVRGDAKFADRPTVAWAADFRSPDGNHRAAAGEKLKNGGKEALPVLEALLTFEGDPEPRRWAADLLGQIGADARSATPALVAALNDPDEKVQAVAVRSLGALAPEAPGAVEGLCGIFPNVEAIRAVALYKDAGAPAVPKLIPLLSHPDVVVRWNAARTLQKIGPASEPAIPELVKQLSDPDAVVREHAAEAFGPIGPPSAVALPELVKVLDDKDWHVRRDALRSFGALKGLSKPYLAKIRTLKADPQAEVRDEAGKAERFIDPSLAK